MGCWSHAIVAKWCNMCQNVSIILYHKFIWEFVAFKITKILLGKQPYQHRKSATKQRNEQHQIQIGADPGFHYKGSADGEVRIEGPENWGRSPNQLISPRYNAEGVWRRAWMEGVSELLPWFFFLKTQKKLEVNSENKSCSLLHVLLKPMQAFLIVDMFPCLDSSTWPWKTVRSLPWPHAQCKVVMKIIKMIIKLNIKLNIQIKTILLRKTTKQNELRNNSMPQLYMQTKWPILQ